MPGGADEHPRRAEKARGVSPWGDRGGAPPDLHKGSSLSERGKS